MRDIDSFPVVQKKGLREKHRNEILKYAQCNKIAGEPCRPKTEQRNQLYSLVASGGLGLTHLTSSGGIGFGWAGKR